MPFHQKRLGIPALNVRMFNKMFWWIYSVIWYSMWHWHIIWIFSWRICTTPDPKIFLESWQFFMGATHLQNFSIPTFGADRTLLKHRVLRRWNQRRPVFLAVLSFRNNLCLHATKKTERSICSTFTQWVERLEFILWRRFLSEHVGITVLVLHVSVS